MPGADQEAGHGLPRAQWLTLSYDAVRPKNLALFRRLNSVLFPISYADKVYAEAMAAGRVTQLGASQRRER